MRWFALHVGGGAFAALAGMLVPIDEKLLTAGSRVDAGLLIECCRGHRDRRGSGKTRCAKVTHRHKIVRVIEAAKSEVGDDRVIGTCYPRPGDETPLLPCLASICRIWPDCSDDSWLREPASPSLALEDVADGPGREAFAERGKLLRKRSCFVLVDLRGAHDLPDPFSRGTWKSPRGSSSAWHAWAPSRRRPGSRSTSRMYGFSLFGRPHSSLRKPIGLGVCVSVASPAWCRAAIRKPVAIETNSGT